MLTISSTKTSERPVEPFIDFSEEAKQRARVLPHSEENPTQETRRPQSVSLRGKERVSRGQVSISNYLIIVSVTHKGPRKSHHFPF